MTRHWRSVKLVAILLVILVLTGCKAQHTESKGSDQKSTDTLGHDSSNPSILIDGVLQSNAATVSAPYNTPVVSFQVGGQELLSLPFAEPHTVVIRQPDGQENTLRMTGSSVQMAEATCPNHDCVQMGEVTLENLELRAMGGFIVCLPHQLTVEVRLP